jgi:hypothetical protein
MPDVTQAGATTCPELRTLHHAGVQLDFAVAVQGRADAGVEERLVFHVADRRNRRGQGTVADLAPPDVAGAFNR